MKDAKQILIDLLISCGWKLKGDVISKDNCSIRFGADGFVMRSYHVDDIDENGEYGGSRCECDCEGDRQ